MEEELKKYYFDEEYERERARDAYRSDKVKKTAKKPRWFSSVYCMVMMVSAFYGLYLFKDMGIDLKPEAFLEIYFVTPILVILATFFLGFFVFPKG